MDFIKEAIKLGFIKGNKVLRIAYQSDNIGNIIYLINIFKNVIKIRQITVGLKEIFTIVKKLCQFQATALYLINNFYSIIIPKSGRRTLSVLK